MSTTSAPEVVHDGSVERTVDPEEVSLAAAYRVSSTFTAACASEPPPCGHTQVAMQRAVQDSLASGKMEQISRDAALARALAARERASL